MSEVADITDATFAEVLGSDIPVLV